jgi:hypothetical protein
MALLLCSRCGAPRQLLQHSARSLSSLVSPRSFLGQPRYLPRSAPLRPSAYKSGGGARTVSTRPVTDGSSSVQEPILSSEASTSSSNPDPELSINISPEASEVCVCLSLCLIPTWGLVKLPNSVLTEVVLCRPAANSEDTEPVRQSEFGGPRECRVWRLPRVPVQHRAGRRTQKSRRRLVRLSLFVPTLSLREPTYAFL